jgi:hemerythrin-like domain-containing protein
MTLSTQELIDEHGGIMLMLSIMERVANKLGHGEAVSGLHLSQILEFLQNFADKCHHGKEEDILFPELAKNPAHLAAVNELLGEHKTGRDLIAGMVKSLVTYQPGSPEAFHLAANMNSYVDLLKQHIRKENDHVFQFADQELSAELNLSLKQRYDELESEIIGVGKHEEYHRWLEELKAAYLMN